MVAAELSAPGAANNAGDLALNDGATYFGAVRPVLYNFADQLFEYVERYVTTRPPDVTCRVIGLIVYSGTGTSLGSLGLHQVLDDYSLGNRV